MLLLTLGQTAEELVVTLNEKRTLSSGYYLWIFTHTTTKDQVTKIFNFSEDESDYPDRFNQFPINTQGLFVGKPTGQWKYDVYEQASSTNTDPAGLTMVETGYMKLRPASEFEFSEYDESTSFKQYGG
jgi:hypothetical protein